MGTPDIKIHGGFDPANGIVALTDARIFASNGTMMGTILSGDIDGNDTLISPAPSNGNLYTNNGGNSYHVVNASTANTNSLLDGVHISRGNANGTGLEQYGGGVFSSSSSSVVITNSTVSNNSAAYSGGGVYSYSYSRSSSVVITNSSISYNTNVGNASTEGDGGGGVSSSSTSSSVIISNSTVSNNLAIDSDGGGVYSTSIYSDSSSSFVIINNSTVSNNAATNRRGGGVYSEVRSSTSTITSNNSIFAGNTASSNANYYNNRSTTTFTNSYVSGENLSASNNNLDGTAYSITDIFTNPANGDYSLKNTSPAVNAGDNSLYTGTLATDNDVAGNPRLFNGSPNPDVIDMGAYELQAEPLKPDANNILYVNKNVIGGNGSGDSWANAIPELADALNWAKNNPSWASSATPLKIYVAVGTYYPTAVATNRTASFILGADIKIHGGFDPANGIVALTDARIFAGNSITAGTILSGDIDGNDTLISPAPSNGNLYNNNAGNSYHVVNASTANTNSLLDGVRISHGNANGTGLERNGGGVFSDSTSTSSVVITNSTVSNNSANRNGGGVYSTSTSTSSSSVVITNSTVSNNNSANSRGGGVFSDSYSTSSVVITNSTVSNNLANSDGGGVYSFSDSSSVIITNSLVSNNSASYSGGGVFSTSTSFSSSSSVVITNSTVSNNSANHDGGGVFSDSFYSSSTITSNNSIFAGNTATNAGANYYNNLPTNTFTNSYVSGENLSGSNNNLDGTAYSITDIFTDPANGDYSLKNTSPAVNAGNNSLYTTAGGNLTTDNDLAGNPRLFSGSPNPDVIDMGAYELQAEPLMELSIATTTQGPEDTTNGLFTITTTKQFSTPTTVNFSVTGTATQGVDYSNLGTSFTFPANTNSVTITVPIIADNIVEQNETVIVTLTSTNNAAVTIGTSDNATVTITDDDTAELSIATTTQALEDTTNGLFTITTTKQFATPTTVNFSVTGTATQGTDYGNIGTSIVFPANTNTATIIVDVTADTVTEPDETIIVTLTGTNNAAVTIGSSDNATVTITDDDIIPATITFADVNKTYGDANFNLSATSNSTGTITYSVIGSANGTGLSGTNNALVNIGNVATVTIRATLPANGSYSSATKDITLTITKAVLTATADDKTKVFGEVNPALTISYSGFKNGDTETDLDTSPVASCLATNTTPAGTISIDLVGGEDANYTIITENGILTILSDNDGDGISDEDDEDDDNDGVLDVDDNSPDIPNPDQLDTDDDGVPDVEEDCDNDGIINYYDTDLASCLNVVLQKKKYGFSPNGDGINDTWTINNIYLYPNNKVKVFNRSGKMVYEKSNYKNTWNGFSNKISSSKKLPVGSYLFIIELNKEEESIQGWLYINY